MWHRSVQKNNYKSSDFKVIRPLATDRKWDYLGLHYFIFSFQYDSKTVHLIGYLIPHKLK